MSTEMILFINFMLAVIMGTLFLIYSHKHLFKLVHTKTYGPWCLYENVQTIFYSLCTGLFCIITIQYSFSFWNVVLTWAIISITFVISFLWMTLVLNENYRWPSKRYQHTIAASCILTLPAISYVTYLIVT